MVRALAVVRADGVVRVEGDPAFSPGALPLRDVHVLRAVLAWAGVIDEPAITVRCDNCGESRDLIPSRELEIGPFVDGELDDPELDRPFDFARARSLPRPGASPIALRLVPRSLDEAAPLLARSPAAPLRFTASIVTAMGIASLAGAKRASRLARVLEGMSDRTWDALVEVYDEAHYSPRLFGSVRCGCGANVGFEAPHDHELLGEAADRRRVDAAIEVPSVEAFQAIAERIATEVLARRRVPELVVLVDDGVAACDDGGAPLLGSYTPSHLDPDTSVETPPEVRLYYRTFVAELREIPHLDLDGEIRDTLEHEVQHHLFDLSGDDPMDAEERREIAREAGSVVGKRELLRREARREGGELYAFLRATWPFFLLGALALGFKYCI